MDAMDRIYIGDFSAFETIEDFERSLAGLLGSGCYIWSDGRLVAAKQLVEKIGSLRIEIRPREHAPPHFHVCADGISASFTIDGCRLLKGDISKKEEALVRYWYATCGDQLVEVWNKTRPTDCVVGPITKKVT